MNDTGNDQCRLIGKKDHPPMDIIRIGNSQGIRIPKHFIEQRGLKGRVEMNVENNALVIAPAREARNGWSDTFRTMAKQGDDAPLLNEDDHSDWDESEWERE